MVVLQVKLQRNTGSDPCSLHKLRASRAEQLSKRAGPSLDLAERHIRLLTQSVKKVRFHDFTSKHPR
jgi:hypothetical protein